MITDRQVSIVAKILSQGFSDNDARVRKALEAYEASRQKPKPLSESYVRKLESDAYRYSYGYSEVIRITEQAHGIGTSHEPT